MADKKESALGAVTDFAQARVLDASGASKNIDKATMASVLAASMVQVDNSGKSLDEYKQTGIYGGYDFSDKPISGIGTCILEVIAYSSTNCIQRLTTIDSDNTYCFIRRLNNGSWKEWVQITTTAL